MKKLVNVTFYLKALVYLSIAITIFKMKMKALFASFWEVEVLIS